MLFREILCNNNIKRKLLSSYHNSMIPHSQFFFGKSGSPNLVLAIAYSQYLMCKKKNKVDSCGRCESCIKYKKFTHPDLHFIFPLASVNKTKPLSINFIKYWQNILLDKVYFSHFDWLNLINLENKKSIINVDEIKNLTRKIYLKPYESNIKVIIIWMPEKMNNQASNKILKILEEPPSNTYIIFVGNSKDELLPTVLSRLQITYIPNFTDSEINEYLISLGVDSSKSNVISKLVDGDLSKAISLTSNKTNDSVLEEDFITWMRLCFSLIKKNNSNDLILFLGKISKYSRENQIIFLSYSLSIFRDAFMTNIGQKNLKKIIFLSENFNFNKFSSFINFHNFEKIVNLFNQSILNLERNANSNLLYLDISIKLCYLMNINLKKN